MNFELMLLLLKRFSTSMAGVAGCCAKEIVTIINETMKG
jgi:hypothetical protein